MLSRRFNAEAHYFKMYDVISTDERKKINIDRKELKRKITLGLATKEEIMKQIVIDFHLLNTCQLKIDQKIKENNDEYISTEILAILSNRVNDLYHIMFIFYSVEETSLSEYIKFWSKNKSYISKKNHKSFPDLMIRYHNNPEIYIIGATYDYNDRNDVEAARRYFAEGLKHHANYKNLYVKEFLIEVQHLEKTAGASLPFAINSYKKLIDRFGGDMELHFMLLDRTTRFKMITELQCFVVRDMVDNYGHSEFMWERLAKLNINGFIYNHETKHLYYDRNYINGIKHCVKTYEYGLKQNLPSKNKLNLWSFYVHYVINVRTTRGMYRVPAVRNFIDETMERVFQEAHDNKASLEPKYYNNSVDNTTNDYYKILKLALSAVGNDVDLWTKISSYCIGLKDCDFIMDAFRGGYESLKQDSLPLWKMTILYLKNIQSELLQPLYEEGVHSEFKNINTYVKSNYLDWCFSQNGINATRELFNKLTDLNPKSKHLNQIMIQCEIYQNKTTANIEAIRILYNNLCNSFGIKDVGVWIEYMRFEYIYGTKLLVNDIYERSLTLLEPELHNDVAEELDSLKIEFKKTEPEDK